MPKKTVPKWFFVRVNLNDQIGATLEDLPPGSIELSQEARVVREAIQNSADATIPNEKTNVFIWNKTVQEDEVDQFRDLIGYRNNDSPFKRLKKLGLGKDNALERMQSRRKDRSFNVTIIEDRNTCGLGYDPVEGIDRFDQLCISHGKDSTNILQGKGWFVWRGKSSLPRSLRLQHVHRVQRLQTKPEGIRTDCVCASVRLRHIRRTRTQQRN